MATKSKPTTTPEQETNMTENETMTGSLLDDFQNTAVTVDEDQAVDMSFDDVYDEVVHPTGTEVKLRCTAAKVGESENSKYWLLTYEDADDPHVKEIREFVTVASKREDVKPRTLNNIKKAFMKFKAAHGFPINDPIKAADIPGRTAWAVLRQEEDPKYGAQNKVSSWIAPKGGAAAF